MKKYRYPHCITNWMLPFFRNGNFGNIPTNFNQAFSYEEQILSFQTELTSFENWVTELLKTSIYPSEIDIQVVANGTQSKIIGSYFYNNQTFTVNYQFSTHDLTNNKYYVLIPLDGNENNIKLDTIIGENDCVVCEFSMINNNGLDIDKTSIIYYNPYESYFIFNKINNLPIFTSLDVTLNTDSVSVKGFYYNFDNRIDIDDNIPISYENMNDEDFYYINIPTGAYFTDNLSKKCIISKEFNPNNFISIGYVYINENNPEFVKLNPYFDESVIGELEKEILDEKNERIEQDAILNDRIETEIFNRVSADGILSGQITQEVTDRANGDNTLNTKIDTETENRKTADSVINSRLDMTNLNLSAEIGDRKNQANTLKAGIDKNTADLASEVTNRTNADNTTNARIDTTNSNLSTETQNRINADNALNTRIDNLPTGGGVNTIAINGPTTFTNKEEINGCLLSFGGDVGNVTFPEITGSMQPQQDYYFYVTGQSGESFNPRGFNYVYVDGVNIGATGTIPFTGYENKIMLGRAISDGIAGTGGGLYFVTIKPPASVPDMRDITNTPAPLTVTIDLNNLTNLPLYKTYYLTNSKLTINFSNFSGKRGFIYTAIIFVDDTGCDFTTNATQYYLNGNNYSARAGIVDDIANGIPYVIDFYAIGSSVIGIYRGKYATSGPS